MVPHQRARGPGRPRPRDPGRTRAAARAAAAAAAAVLLGAPLPADAQQVRTSVIRGFEFSEFDAATNERQYTLTGDAEFGRDPRLVKLTSVRVYLFEEGGATNMVMRTTLAMFDQETKRAESEEPVLIESAQLRISGIGMLWEPTARRLVLDRDVRIEMFDTAGLLPEPAPASGAPEAAGPAPAAPRPARGEPAAAAPARPPTIVDAAHLTYDMNAREVILSGGVAAVDGNTRLTAETARLALAEQGSSARQIEAGGAVTIVRGGLVARGGRAEYDVESKRITLLDQPVVSRGADRLESRRLDWDAESGQMHATGEPRLILARAIQAGREDTRRTAARPGRQVAAAAPPAPTEIYADDLHFDMGQNRARFEGNVVVLSPAVSIGASRMDVQLEGGLAEGETEAAPPEGAVAADQGGDVAEIVAEGLVEIVQHDLRALCERASYDPETGEVQLTGQPRVLRGEDQLAGERIWLNVDEERLRCGPDARVVIADAGRVEGRVLGGGGEAPARRRVEISSREVEFWLAENRGLFRDQVRVRSHDVTIASQRLETFLARVQDERVLARIVAEGDVEIVQGDRRARSGRAVYDALQGEVVLTESPELAGDRVVITADQITFYVDKDQLYCDPRPRLLAYPEGLPQWAAEAAGREPGAGRSGRPDARAGGPSLVPHAPGREEEGTAGTFRRGEVPPADR